VIFIFVCCSALVSSVNAEEKVVKADQKAGLVLTWKLADGERVEEKQWGELSKALQNRLSKFVGVEVSEVRPKDGMIEAYCPKLTLQKVKVLKERGILSGGKFAIYKTLRNSDAVIAKMLKPDGSLDKVMVRDLYGEGYCVLPYTFHVKNAEEVNTFVIVDRNGVIGNADIKRCWPNHQTGSSVSVELTDKGGEKMKKFTRTLTPNVDRMAAVLSGQVLTNATLAAPELGKRFEIIGMRDIEQCKAIATGLNYTLPVNLTFVEATPLKK